MGVAQLLGVQIDRKKFIALSSTAFELIASVDAVKHILWTNRFLEELGIKQTPILRIDNQSTLRLICNDEIFHKRTRHIDIRFYYLRNLVKENTVKVVYTPTEEQKANIFTKCLNGPMFLRAQRQLVTPDPRKLL